MEAPAKLQQEGEEYDLKVEVEEEVVGLLSWQSTTRKYGVHEGGVSGNGDSSTDSSRTSKNGTHAEEEPEAGQEWVEEVNGGENDVEAKGPETEAEQEPGEEREAAPERDEVDENGSNGGANGKGDVAVLAPAAKTEPHSHNGVKMNESTWTNIVHFDDGRGIESIQRIVKTEYSDVERVSYETETVDVTSNVATRRFSAFQSSLVDNQERGISGDERSPRKSNEEKNTYSKESEVVEEEPNPGETEFDVERVLEKQNTHDLYCPNCQSRITRTVILERKERKLPYVRDPPSEPAPQPEPYHTPSIRDHPRDGDQRAFKCQTCFGIFILKGVWPFIVKEDADPREDETRANGKSPKDANTQPPTDEPIPPSLPIVPGPQKIDQKPTEENPEKLSAVNDSPAITGLKPSPAQPSPAELPNEVDVIVEIDTLTAPTSDVAAQPGTQTLPEEPPVVQPHQPREWDILKSIVYGGLIESITSLAVVSSAAGAGAATLNTLGLGLANLFGGLIVIGHNLRELKNEQPSQGTEQVDRYQEVLGKRQHFPRHAIVAILSFIIFGCVAPITYAFSFRESDNRDYKLAAVAAASLLCIFLLAIGKAYVRKPPKAYFETVLHYVIMGFMASGISFLVGELIDELLTKLGWFNSTSSLSGTGALETGTMQSGWASY
ncbi:membrane protein of ER body-like protein [Eucalyptus grandis]|uniref:membrane protein of ER body-like protein n=1 Tax=Eucalyptus grandis TaxID=71139 RepID=UPI00192EBF73|nr:membrane protein of ER body-like protein [Eucalyptus grandis]